MKKKILLILSFVALTVICKSQIITDYDGNNYNTVTIGTQIWMKENLKTTHYNNGDSIGTTYPTTLSIQGITNPKYQWPCNGEKDSVSRYGRLYTWFTVTDARGVCPIGWHIPTETEFLNLDTLMQANYNIFPPTPSYTKALSDTIGWGLLDSVANNGAPGSIDHPQLRNITGFSARGAGHREYNGQYVYTTTGQKAAFWSSTNYNSTNAKRFYFMNSAYCNYAIDPDAKKYGFSARCTKDIVTSQSDIIKEKSLNIYPNPAHNKLEIDGLANSTIEIIDLQGHLVMSHKATSTKMTLDISKLSNGFYTIRILTNNNIIVSKFIKQ